jgi:peptide/nickel transport system substrate-binding protein
VTGDFKENLTKKLHYSNEPANGPWHKKHINCYAFPKNRQILNIRKKQQRKGIGRILIAIIVVVVVIVAGIGAYYAVTLGKSSTTSGPTSTTSKSNPTSLVVEEGTQPDSLDPAVEFTTPGNEITSNVYQALVAPSNTTAGAYVGVLASSWATSADQMHWNFTLRQGVNFSNGDPFNAYVMWYSLYRTIVMNQAPAFILEQNFANTSAVVNVSASTLNSINYASPSSANLTVMETPGQSFQVINQNEIELNVGLGYNGNVSYSALLATLTAPSSFAVDPKVVSANGGVIAGQKNSWMQTNAIGTGFYLCNSGCWVNGQSVTLVKNTHYWGNSLPASQLNYALQPAILQSITIYYKPVTSRITDLKSGAAQIIGVPDASEVSSVSSLRSIPNVDVTVLPIAFGSSNAAYYIYMNPFINSQFSSALVREAITYAINYNGLISSIFSGLAQTWIGPVPPGFPDYNQSVQGLSPYTYNATKAAELLNEAGYNAKLPSGQTLTGSKGAFPTLNFVYSPDLVSESEVAPIIANELSAIGITVTQTSMTFDAYTAYLFTTTPNAISSGVTNGFGIGYYSEDYFASQDYVTAFAGNNYTAAPDLFTNESTFAANAAGATDPTTLLQAYQNATTTMLNSYSFDWLYVPDFLSASASNVAGMYYPNPTGSCAGYFMYYNTVHYT